MLVHVLCLLAACERDYSAACPAGWVAAGTSCSPPSSYAGPCGAEDFAGYNSAMLEKWSSECGACLGENSRCPLPSLALRPDALLRFLSSFIFLGHMRHVRGRQQGSESYSLYLVPFRVEYLWCEARGGITFQSPGSGRASECGAAWPTLCFDLRSSHECWAALAYRDAWMGRGCVWSAARDLRARQAVLSFVLLLHRVPAPAREAGAGSFPCAETRVCVSCGSEAVSDSF